jgi:heme A synthase
LIKRVRAEGFTPSEFHKICVTALVLVAVIVVTGAAVRLTGSGLGCVDWPNCNASNLVDVSSQHSAIEQINRLFTFVVGLAVVLARSAHGYDGRAGRDLLMLSMALVAHPSTGNRRCDRGVDRSQPCWVQLHFVPRWSWSPLPWCW